MEKKFNHLIFVSNFKVEQDFKMFPKFFVSLSDISVKPSKHLIFGNIQWCNLSPHSTVYIPFAGNVIVFNTNGKKTFSIKISENKSFYGNLKLFYDDLTVKLLSVNSQCNIKPLENNGYIKIQGVENLKIANKKRNNEDVQFDQTRYTLVYCALLIKCTGFYIGKHGTTPYNASLNLKVVGGNIKLENDFFLFNKNYNNVIQNINNYFFEN